MVAASRPKCAICGAGLIDCVVAPIWERAVQEYWECSGCGKITIRPMHQALGLPEYDLGLPHRPLCDIKNPKVEL